MRYVSNNLYNIRLLCDSKLLNETSAGDCMQKGREEPQRLKVQEGKTQVQYLAKMQMPLPPF